MNLVNFEKMITNLEIEMMTMTQSDSTRYYARNLNEVSAEHVNLLFKNRHAMVSEIVLKPGEKLPPHRGGQRVYYALTNFETKLSRGKQFICGYWHPGSVHWHQEDVHTLENIGDTEAKFLVFSRKYSLLPEVILDRSSYFAEVVPDFAHIRVENEFVRVTEVTLPAGEELPEHIGLGRLIYSLTDYEVFYESNKMEAANHSIKEGSIYWHGTDRYVVRNIGKTMAHFFIVAFKK